METLQTYLRDLMSEALFWWLMAGSIALLIFTMLLVPWIVVRLPADYFHHRKRHPAGIPRISWLHAAFIGLKNLAGGFLILAGIAMLVLPGQGVLTLLIGLSMVNFPGKYRLERRLVSLPPVLHSMNWLRRRSGKPDFLIPRIDESESSAKTGNEETDAGSEMRGSDRSQGTGKSEVPKVSERTPANVDR